MKDLNFFFSGTPDDYARLFSSLLAARHADPHPAIVFGGLAHFEKPNWLRTY
jgi:hypothetical protein